MKPDTQTTSFHDLRDALAQPGCAVCRLKADSAGRFPDRLLWESVNDVISRHRIRQAQGFCHAHAWSLVRAGASLGVAIIMHDVLGSVLTALESAVFQATAPWSVRRVHETLDPRRPAAATAEAVARLEPQAACPACEWVEKMESLASSSARKTTGFDTRRGARSGMPGCGPSPPWPAPTRINRTRIFADEHG